MKKWCWCYTINEVDYFVVDTEDNAHKNAKDDLKMDGAYDDGCPAP